LEERLVEAAGGSKLHAARGAGNGDGGDSGEAEGRGVAQQARARIAMVGVCVETCDGGAGEHDQLVLCEKLIDAQFEVGMTLPIYVDFRGSDA